MSKRIKDVEGKVNEMADDSLKDHAPVFKEQNFNLLF